MSIKSIFIALVLSFISVQSFASIFVNQEDLDSWISIPVIALDTHSLFATLPVARTVTETGVEVRVYSNKTAVGRCFDSGTVMSSSQWNAYQNCSAKMVGCDNIFYIRDGKVLEYKVEGRCKTGKVVRPQKGWEKFLPAQ